MLEPCNPWFRRRPWLMAATALCATPTCDAALAGEDAPEPASVVCFRHAEMGVRDAYPCDLAVQMARDSGSAAELTAALANRARVLASDGRLEPALEDLDAALAVMPDNADLHGNRGNLLLRLGQPAQALEAHDRAVALAPRDPTVYYNRAFSHRALGDLGRAGEDVAAARALAARAPRPPPAAEAFSRSGTPAPADDRPR